MGNLTERNQRNSSGIFNNESDSLLIPKGEFEQEDELENFVSLQNEDISVVPVFENENNGLEVEDMISNAISGVDCDWMNNFIEIPSTIQNEKEEVIIQEETALETIKIDEPQPKPQIRTRNYPKKEQDNNEAYLKHRRLNNQASIRSRQKRKEKEKQNEELVVKLAKENEELKKQFLELKTQYNEMLQLLQTSVKQQ